MMKIKSIVAAALAVLALGGAAGAAENTLPPKQSWTFAGVFGTYDENQLQRGFQVFREVCSSCHGARLIAFRNFGEAGGPGFSEGQVKALAAEYDINDPEAEGGVRPGIAADRWPSPFASEQDARDANGGALPPDFSVIAKARGTNEAFPGNFWNYITAYSEAGPDYIYALLTGYEEVPPADFELAEGKFYNHYFAGHAIGMAPPLSDGAVTYSDPDFPQTVDQYARDFAAFAMWMAEPHLVARKEAGFRVILFLFLLAGLMWFVKERIWAPVHHQEHEDAAKAKSA